jgi:nucleotide-binding universal stress UspA family protein
MTTEQRLPAYKILVAVAFDPTSDPALYEAMSLATRSPGAELHAVHVLADSTGAEDRRAPTLRDIQEASRLLRERLDVACEHARGIKIIAHLRAGDPADSILRAADDVQADVIVAGSHRRTGLRRLALGSVAERVLHESHCPVLIAVPKDYASSSASAQVEPPCEACLQARAQSAGARFWCERHSKPYVQPHVYVPRDEARSSVFPTY